MKRGKIRNAKKVFVHHFQEKKKKKTFKEKHFANDKNFGNRKVNASKIKNSQWQQKTLFKITNSL